MTASPVDVGRNGLDLSLTLRRGEFELSAAARVRDGEVLAVLGPNGAGKSTLLRAVAGLAAIDAGRISLGDTVFDAPAERAFLRTQQREVGVVFQDHRLFGQQRVLGNVAFGARARGTAKATANTAAQAWLERLGVGALAKRRPGELSGGEAQRVALARALASGPRALLLDEPLAALDVQTRAQVQGELHRHLAEFAGPTLLVTHDPIEALLLADRIVVLEHGRVVQHGTPAQITSTPSTPYVARLVGANLFRARLDGARVRLDAGVVLAADDVPADPGAVLVAVRSSAIEVHTAPPVGKRVNVWPGVIEALAPLGDRIRVGVRGVVDADVDIDAARLGADDGGHFAPGQTVWLSVDPRDVRVYSPAPSGVAG